MTDASFAFGQYRSATIPEQRRTRLVDRLGRLGIRRMEDATQFAEREVAPVIRKSSTVGRDERRVFINHFHWLAD